MILHFDTLNSICHFFAQLLTVTRSINDDCMSRGCNTVLIRELREEDPLAFHDFLRMEEETFCDLLQVVKGASDYNLRSRQLIERFSHVPI